jgi:hypothetical protein
MQPDRVLPQLKTFVQNILAPEQRDENTAS